MSTNSDLASRPPQPTLDPATSGGIGRHDELLAGHVQGLPGEVQDEDADGEQRRRVGCCARRPARDEQGQAGTGDPLGAAAVGEPHSVLIDATTREPVPRLSYTTPDGGRIQARQTRVRKVGEP